jgi:hypothetical protein
MIAAAAATRKAPAAPRSASGAAPLTVTIALAPTARATSPAPVGGLELPDGRRLAALNGAVGAPALATAWDPAVPFAEVVGTRVGDDGVAWYVHADGTQSTTRMVWRPDLGRLDAVTSVAHPGVGERPPVRGR